MNKKGKIDLMFLLPQLIIIGGLLLMISFFIIDTIIEQKEECESKGLPVWTCEREDMCKVDCNRLNKPFYNYDDSGFGSKECWCLDGNSPTQIS